MPKYYCDYCDAFLTHDSPSVRKTHNGGRKHKENVRMYYQAWMEEQAQKLIDATTRAFTTQRMLAPGAPGFVPPGMPVGMPPRMPFPMNPAMAAMGMVRPPVGPPAGMIPPPMGGFFGGPTPPVIMPPGPGAPAVTTTAPAIPPAVPMANGAGAAPQIPSLRTAIKQQPLD